MADHDWHLFDEECGYEVCRSVADGVVTYGVRRVGETEETWLSEREFDQWRRKGPNPRGLD